MNRLGDPQSNKDVEGDPNPSGSFSTESDFEKITMSELSESTSPVGNPVGNEVEVLDRGHEQGVERAEVGA